MSTYNPDFKLNQQELLYALFNHDNALSLTPETLQFGTPASGSAGYNSSIEVTMPQADCDIKTAIIRYNRIDLTRLFSVVTCGLLSTNFVDGTINLASIKEELLSQYGLNASDGFTVIKLDDGRYKLVAEDNNLSYLGSTFIELIPSLRDRVQLTLLDGFGYRKKDFELVQVYTGSTLEQNTYYINGFDNSKNKPIIFRPRYDYSAKSLQINTHYLLANQTVNPGMHSSAKYASVDNLVIIGCDGTCIFRTTSGRYMFTNPRYKNGATIQFGNMIDDIKAELAAMSGVYLNNHVGMSLLANGRYYLVCTLPNSHFQMDVTEHVTGMMGSTNIVGTKCVLSTYLDHCYFLRRHRMMECRYENGAIRTIEVAALPELNVDTQYKIKIISMSKDDVYFTSDYHLERDTVFYFNYVTHEFTSYVIDTSKTEGNAKVYPEGFWERLANSNFAVYHLNELPFIGDTK